MNSSVTLNRLVEDFRNQPYFGRKFDLAADQQFCLTGISDLGVKLTVEQTNQMFALLTPEQLETINNTLDSGKGWY